MYDSESLICLLHINILPLSVFESQHLHAVFSAVIPIDLSSILILKLDWKFEYW